MGWYTHATVFVLVNLLLLLKSGMSGHHWAIFPAFGWGLGLLVHGFVVFFGSAGGFGLRQSLLERERQRHEWTNMLREQLDAQLHGALRDRPAAAPRTATRRPRGPPGGGLPARGRRPCGRRRPAWPAAS